jgi:nitrite reductase/ring-hydroxylating ferredoxin subunit
MTDLSAGSRGAGAVRDDFVPKDAFLSREFLALEKERLWPKVWLMACRLEELKNVGDYVTFDIADDSVIIVRSAPDKITALHNVCPHRGRRMTNGTGRVGQFVCRFHGWKYNLDGSNREVIDREDWKGGLSDSDVAMREVRLDTWGGWVFVNMDGKAEPLLQYLAPIPELWAKWEFEKWRFKWYKTVILPCNWKVVLGAFNEAYHVQQTHKQLLPHAVDGSVSEGFNRHGKFWYPSVESGRSRFSPSPRLGPQPPIDEIDTRKHVIGNIDELYHELGAMATARMLQASHRLMLELPASAPAQEVLVKWRQFHKEINEIAGVGWPNITLEDIGKAGNDWHVFPNWIFLAYPDGMIQYRGRPNGDDPDSCIFDVCSIERYTPGSEPPLARELYDDWKKHDGWGRILTQDFENMADVQRGMKSRGFPGSRTNPVQERSISNFHRVLRGYIYPDG